MHEKPSVGSHLDKFRLLDFSSTTLEEYWKGSQGLRDCAVEKGLIPSVGCVDVLEVRLTLM